MLTQLCYLFVQEMFCKTSTKAFAMVASMVVIDLANVLL